MLVGRIARQVQQSGWDTQGTGGEVVGPAPTTAPQISNGIVCLEKMKRTGFQIKWRCRRARAQAGYSPRQIESKGPAGWAGPAAAVR